MPADGWRPYVRDGRRRRPARSVVPPVGGRGVPEGKLLRQNRAVCPQRSAPETSWRRIQQSPLPAAVPEP
eukprot:7368385-Pyramimonas_sp.AAC.2